MDNSDLIGLVFTIVFEIIFLWLVFTLRASVFRIERILSELEDRMDSSEEPEVLADSPEYQEARP